MILNSKKNYGFTRMGISNTDSLPVWDKFRLRKIRDIFRTGGLIIDFGDSSRALSELL